MSRSARSRSNCSLELVACCVSLVIAVLLASGASRPLRVLTALHLFQQARRAGTAKPLAASLSNWEQGGNGVTARLRGWHPRRGFRGWRRSWRLGAVEPWGYLRRSLGAR